MHLVFTSYHKFTSTDGIELDAFGVLTGKTRVVIHSHGMASRAYSQAFHEPLARMYGEHGFDYLSVTNRGSEVLKSYKHIGSGTDELLGYAHELFTCSHHDLLGAIAFAESLGYTEILLQGHSSGCQKIAYTLSKERPSTVKAVVLVSPCDDIGLAHLWYGGKEQWEEKIKEAKRAKKQGTPLLPENFAFHMPVSPQTFLDHFEEHSPFDCFHYWDQSRDFDVFEHLPDPTLALFGSEDLFAHKDRIPKIYDAAKHVDLDFIEGANHKYAGVEEILAKRIAAFIKAKELQE